MKKLTGIILLVFCVALKPAGGAVSSDILPARLLISSDTPDDVVARIADALSVIEFPFRQPERITQGHGKVQVHNVRKALSGIFLQSPAGLEAKETHPRYRTDDIIYPNLTIPVLIFPFQYFW